MYFQLKGSNCQQYFSYAVLWLKLILTKLPIAEQQLLQACLAVLHCIPTFV